MVRSWLIGVGGFEPRIVSEDEAAAGLSPFQPLPSVAPAVRQVERALRRFEVAGWLDIDPDHPTATAMWKNVQEQTVGGPLVVLFAGHGEVLNNDLYLATVDSERGTRLRPTALNVTTMLGDIEAGATGPALFLLDVCGAGAALSAQQFHQLADQQRKTWVIAACAVGESTFGARFTMATAQVLERLANGWLDITPSLPFVPVETLAAEIDRELGRTVVGVDGGSTVVRTPTEEATVQPAPFFANPNYATDPAARYRARTNAALWQLAADSDPALDPVHFVTRAAGNGAADRCLFTGRTEERERIARWMAAEPGHATSLLLVTGSPGSGKSALLGVVACLTHRQLRPVANAVATRIQDHRPRPRVPVLAVHARQRTSTEIVTSLLRQLEPDSDSIYLENPSLATLHTSADRGDLTSLRGRLGAAGPVILVVDALDEAVDPETLLTTVLMPLLADGHCRLLVGSRPWWDRFPALRAAADTPASLLDLDEVGHDRLTADLKAFLDDRLWPDERYGDDITAEIAQRLAAAPDSGGFLLATLFADHLCRAPEAEPRADRIVTELPTTIAQMLDLHLATLSLGRGWIRPVVAALSAACGAGMPLDLVHAVASALAPPSERESADIDDTLDALSEISFYLRTDVDIDGRVLYRYFHQRLIDHARGSAEPAVVLAALTDKVVRTVDGRRAWETAQPYIKRHLADHAADVDGALDELVLDPGFLVHAEPSLAARLIRDTGHGSQRHAAVYRTSVPRHALRHVPEVRRQLLTLDALRWNQPELARTLFGVPTGATGIVPHPVWATGSLVHRALRHSLPHGPGVEAPFVFTLDGQWHLLTSSALYGQTTVRLWSLADGSERHVLAHPDDPSTRVSVVDVVEFNGHRFAITSDNHGVVRAWDLADGIERHTKSTTDDDSPTTWYPDTYSAVPRDDGMAVKVVAADGHLYSVGPTSAGLQVWDLDCGREHLAIPVEPGERKPPRFSGFPLIDGRPHIAVITEDVIRIVDLRTGNEHLNINTDPDDPLNYLFFHVCGDTWYLVTQGTEHIHIYDLDTGTERLNLMPGHVQKLNYCAATIDARRLLIIAVNDDVVYTWSPDNDAATEYRTPARDADSIIRWIHISHEQLMIVSLFDQRVRVWNITTGAIADTFVPVVAQSMPYFVDCAEIPGQIFAVVADPSSHAVVELAPLNIRHIFSHGDGVARTALSYVTSTVVQAGDSALLLTTGWDAVVKVWDLAEDGQLQQPLGGRGAIIGMGLLEQTEHPTAFVNRFGSVSVSDLRDGSTTRTLFRSAEQSWATAANLSVCIGFRHAVMRDHDDRYRIWDYVSGIERPTVDIGNDPTGPVLVTVDGHDHLVEITSDEVMRFHDLETGAARDSTPDRIAAGETIDSWWSLGDRAYVLTTCRDGETRRWTAWNVRTGRREGMFAHPAGPGGRWSTVGGRAGITCVALDGGVVRAWRATDGQLIHTFEHGPDTPVVGLSVADQPGAFYAFTTDDSWRTHVWDLDTGVRVCSFTPSYVRKGWYALFQEVVTIDDRPHVATLNSAALIEVWDLTNGMRRRQIALDRVPSTWLMARDTDDHVRIMIATGGQYGDGVIQMWDLEESVETEPNRLFLPDPVLHMGMSDLGLVVTFGADIALFRYDDRQ